MDLKDALKRLSELGMTVNDLEDSSDINYYSLTTENIKLKDIEREHPERNEKISQHYIVIDSRDRNYELYHTPDNYYIELFEPHRNVDKIELIAVMIPKTEYNVNISNNQFKLSVGGLQKMMYLREGEYTIGTNKNGDDYQGDGSAPLTGILAELQICLNSHPNSLNGFKVLLTTSPPPKGTGNNASIFNRILIIHTGNIPFQVDFRVKQSSFRTLGFKKTEYQSSLTNEVYGNPDGSLLVGDLASGTVSTVGNHSMVSEFDYDLMDDPNYIIMDVEIGSSSLGRLETRNIDTNNKFAVVLYDANDTDVVQTINKSKNSTDSPKMYTTRKPGRLKSLKGTDFDKKVITFVPRITIENFNIVFTKSGNQPYDFHNREHALIFQIDVCDNYTLGV